MTKRMARKIGILVGGLLLLWIFIRYVLPVLLPFLLGTGVALAAEPLVGLLHRKLKLKRWLSSGIGVSLVMCLLVGALAVLIGVLVRQAGQLALPELMDGVYRGMGSLEQWLLSLAASAPAGLQGVFRGVVTGFFSGSSSFVEGIAGELFGFAKGILGTLTSGFFGFATAMLAAFMISSRLPRLKAIFLHQIPQLWRQRYLPILKGVKKAVVGWFSAQLKLTLVILGVLLISFWFLKIPHGILWAVVVAMVDILPVLGCGTVLIPWSLISLLQGQQLRGLGVLGVYALVWLVRAVLEPKLLGKELGLDPLVTLVAIYAGYQLFGVLGMLLAPVLAVAVTRLTFTNRVN